MNYFPIICLPEPIKRAQQSLPSAIVFPQPPPTLPSKPSKRWNLAQAAVEILMAAISTPGISSISPIPQWLLLTIAMGAIAYSSWRQSKHTALYPKARWLQAVHHRVALLAYKRKKRAYERQASSPETIAQHRREQLLFALACTVPYDGKNSSARMGRSEKTFVSHLKRYFPARIHTGVTLTIANYPYPYTPDAAYIDRNTNLHIDIEVDEPYIYGTREAIHYERSRKDGSRDVFFNAKGWVVIRFSEQQVIQHPEGCCKAIAQVIAQTSGDSSYLPPFANIPNLQLQRQWTKEEARQMACMRVRKNYKK